MSIINEMQQLNYFFDKLKKEKNISRAAFVRKFPIKGGYSSLMNHLSGYRPITLEAAIMYIKGFNHYGLNISLADLSIRLNKEAKKWFRLLESTDSSYLMNSNKKFYHIPIIEAQGSCEGIKQSKRKATNQKLIQEQEFFDRYAVKVENLIAVYANGNSMANFIVDKDIVVFDNSKTNIISGNIYLVDHPAGLRIKRIVLNVERKFVLQNLHHDKLEYQDEVVPCRSQLKVIGQFVYRQNG